jgi:hypothetical protein
MKHNPHWIIGAFLFILLLPAASRAQTEETLFFVAAKDSRVKAQAWIDFMKQYDLDIEHYVVSELDMVKNHDFIAIAGGLEEDGIRDLFETVLGDAEVAALEKADEGKMILKEDVWKPGQMVLVFAGKTAAAAAAVRTKTRETWMEYFQEWFDLDEVPGGLKAY